MAFKREWNECVQAQAGVQVQVRSPVAQRQCEKTRMIGMTMVMVAPTLVGVGAQAATLMNWAVATVRFRKFWR